MFDLRYPNMAAAIDAAVIRTVETGRAWAVWSYDIDWDQPGKEDSPCYISDEPHATYCMLVFVTLVPKEAFERALREKELLRKNKALVWDPM